MSVMTAQIVEISGQKMAVLPIDEYRMLLEAVEDHADVEAAVRAHIRREEGEEYIPSEMVDRIISGESALRVWRQHRGLTLEQLAIEVGIRKSFLSEIETGKARGAPALWRKFADALSVSADDILPLD
jgi:ribosome-binding protein aMBF1 (putative translation factor)